MANKNDCCFSSIPTAPLDLPSEIPANILSFSFDGDGGCVDTDISDVDAALLWIEDNIIDKFDVCSVKNADDCSVMKVTSGNAVVTTPLDLMQCIPFTATNQIIKYDGANVTIGFPEFENEPTWLTLVDTYPYQTTTFVGQAGSVPTVNAEEVGLELGCLPSTSICTGTASQVLNTVLNADGELEPSWEDYNPTIADTWLLLSDTTTNTGDETSYAGTAGYFPRVNAAETAIELTQCLPVDSICEGTDSQIIQTQDDGNGNLDPVWVDCLSQAQICPGDDGTFLQTVDNAGVLDPDWVACLEPEYICPGTDGQALFTGTVNGVVEPVWVSIPMDGTWLALPDTTTNTGDETSYAGTAGFISVVNAAETSIELVSCLPAASICPGTDGQIIQTILQPDGVTLTPEWIDCLPITSLCIGAVGQRIYSRDDGTGNIVPQWEDVPDNTWLALTDTFTNTGDETSFTGTAGLIPVSDGANGLTLGCLPVSSICEEDVNQVLQTVDDGTGTLTVEWVDCLPIAQICPSDTAADIVTTITDPVTNELTPVWQATAAGVDNWLALTDTSTATGDETTYAGTNGFIPIVNAGETALELTNCLPESSICPGTANQILQTLDDGAGNLVVNWVDCLPVTNICPSDDDCDRLSSINGVVQYRHDVWVNLCDIQPQPNQDNSATAATIQNYYDTWEGAIASRVNLGGTAQEFMSIDTGNTPPTQGAVITHDLYDGFVDVSTRYAVPINFADEQLGDDSNDFIIYAGGGIPIQLPTINPFTPAAGIREDAPNNVEVDVLGINAFNAFGETGYVITRAGRYQVCFRGYFRGLLPNQPQIDAGNATAQPPEAAVTFQLFMRTLRQNYPTVDQQTILGAATWNIGSNQSVPGMQFTEFVVGCVTSFFDIGDVIQLFVQAETALGNPVYGTNGDATDNVDGFVISFQHDGATGFTITELPGW